MGIKELTSSQWEDFRKVAVTIEDVANMPFEVTSNGDRSCAAGR
ncbi:hypothetical protein [Priestia abyssalis]|nr:hypothetical protein [Priestia abyssalis]